MGSWITGAKVVVFGAFLIVSAGMIAYDVFYLWPARNCERGGAWWDARDRQCLTPIPIWHFTGRRLVSGEPVAAAAQRVAPGTQRTSP